MSEALVCLNRVYIMYSCLDIFNDDLFSALHYTWDMRIVIMLAKQSMYVLHILSSEIGTNK